MSGKSNLTSRISKAHDNNNDHVTINQSINNRLMAGKTSSCQKPQLELHRNEINYISELFIPLRVKAHAMTV